MVGLGGLAAALGSFTAAWYTRLLSEESISKGRSRCDSCRQEIAPRDLIPIVSWLLLKGRCRNCGEKIGADIPIIELLTVFVVIITILGLDLSYTWQGAAQLVLSLAVVVCLVVIGAFDYKTSLIPMVPVYILSGLVLGLYVLELASSGFDSGLLLERLIGTVVFSGLFFAIYLLSAKKWVGLGDVFLLIPLGFLLGWVGLFIAIFFGSFLASIVILAGLATGRLKRHQVVPFGPILILGVFLSLWLGDAAQRAYFGQVIF